MPLLFAWVWVVSATLVSSDGLVCPEGTRLVERSTHRFCEKPDGKKHGPWVVRYASGEKQHEGQFDNDERTGVFREWGLDGVLLAEVHYARGQRHGPSQRWYKARRPFSRGHYVKGRRHGLWRRWMIMGRLESEGHYVDGRRHGVFTTYYTTKRYQGRVKWTGTYREGARHGEFTVKHWDGWRWLTAEFVEGEQQGEPRGFDETGARASPDKAALETLAENASEPAPEPED